MKISGLLVMLCLTAGSANAATFGVRVVSESGEPIAGAAVCIGTHGNYRQFASQFTSTSGEVTVEVPNVPLVVTVSRDRFSGIRLAEPARGFNLIKEVKLLDDVPGPRCRAGSMLVDNGSDAGSLGVDDVFIKSAAGATVIAGEASTEFSTLSLIPSVTGYPSHYRLSDSASFSDSEWFEYTAAAISVPEDLQRTKSVYLQLRRYFERDTGWIEARSDIVSFELPTL
ncbi:MAG: hypothetical protein KTR32_29385 [Granulosicoccus sp.]|nr:hypothetical protein [Granulosicoccus sp.]